MVANNTNIDVIVLAAGNGSRMQSKIPKVLHKIAGQSMLEHVLQCAAAIQDSSVSVVCNCNLLNNEAFVKLAAAYQAKGILQPEQLGTAHAVSCAAQDLNGHTVVILYGDVPLLKPETLECAIQEYRATRADLMVIGFDCSLPNDYGKFVTDREKLIAIVEDKNATPQQKQGALCNSGIMISSPILLNDFLTNMHIDERSGEYYLTEIVSFAYAREYKIGFVTASAEEVLGVNDKAQLAEAESIVQSRLRAAMIANGAHLIAPETVFFTHSVELGSDVVVHPYVYFGKDVKVGSGSEILSFSHIEGVSIGENCTIGPFTRIRAQSNIEANSKVGNFVELKNSTLGSGTKASHLSYIGDASIGNDVNIGAGTIFCNYDGKRKHRSTVADHSSIGANSSIVSPIAIGSHVTIGAGSVITLDVPDSNLAVTRGVQKNIPKRGKKV